ncbi:hypothetical protein CYME_CMI206C [Cyanidioschyzon merolae strain 10D]|uniref:Uncharacterized protein n=1 Tax=Cyanidioschyzon merolae (strain NIES-3377 / 10D) TaxID=280699 RepID=M1V7U0_CYAM1|nr:hypothetical protein CYME_CMI206C [Cyanidioschyzon merolae strain 10D]BAM80079.1 hypothetical protein CYME_CMI206C [Cyanidioschyzon merolae strain 10D]|eukprot:XP_005536365.1 hypothetical protein CYME_CMI206C [Cyanidioschyzon merolae strain 10D]
MESVFFFKPSPGCGCFVQVAPTDLFKTFDKSLGIDAGRFVLPKQKRSLFLKRVRAECVQCTQHCVTCVTGMIGGSRLSDRPDRGVCIQIARDALQR